MKTEHAERRSFNRFPLEARARLFSGQQCWDTVLKDLSLKGVLLEKPEGWTGEIDERFRIELILPNENRLSMAITIAHIHQESIGAHCDRIDVDSFTKLKRIVELNLGDPALLNRELEHLNL